MANRVEVIRLAFEADLSDMRKELAKLPEISSKEAKKMVSALERQYKRAEKAAKKTAKAQKDSAAKVQAGFESAKQAATGFGGAIGGVGGQVEAFARSALEAGKAMGPMGLAAGGTAIAVVGLGMAGIAAAGQIVALVDAAGEAVERLDEISGTEPLPPETIAALEEWEQAALGAEVSSLRLTAVMGGVMADTWTDSIPLVSGLTEILANVVVKVGEWSDELIGLARGLAAVMSVGASEAIIYGISLNAIGDDARAGAEGLVDLAKATEDAAKIPDEGPSYKAFLKARADAEKAAAAASREHAKSVAEAEREKAKATQESLKAIKEQQSAQDKLAKITTTANADLLTDEGKINQAHADRIEAIAEIALASKDAGAVQEAIASADERQIRELQTLETERAENEKQLLREINELDMQIRESMKARAVDAVAQTLGDIDLIASSIGGTIGTLGDLRINMIEETFNANAAAIEKEGEKRRAMKEENIASLLEAGKIDQAEADRRLEHIDELEKADKKKIKKLEKLSEAAALKSFKVQQASQKAQAIIDGARAALALIPAFAFLGPGAPFAAATIATAATSTQLAVISAQKPPDFPTGGLVADRLPGGAAANGDHFAISAQASEGIVTGRGMDALGRDGLDAINTQGGGGGNTFILKLNEQVIARAILGVPGLARQIVGELQAEMRITAGRVAVYGSG